MLPTHSLNYKSPADLSTVFSRPRFVPFPKDKDARHGWISLPPSEKNLHTEHASKHSCLRMQPELTEHAIYGFTIPDTLRMKATRLRLASH